VGGRTLALQEGRCIAFQDSWEHEAWLDASASHARAVLVVDIWHPLLTDEEVKLLTFIRGSAMRGGKAASAAGVLEPQQDFYKVLKGAAEAGCSDQSVFVGLPACPVVDD